MNFLSNWVRSLVGPKQRLAPNLPGPALFPAELFDAATAMALFAHKHKNVIRVLLFGPPGVGKTVFCHALARRLGSELDVNHPMVYISMADLTLQGKSEIEKIGATMESPGPVMLVLDDLDFG